MKRTVICSTTKTTLYFIKKKEKKKERKRKHKQYNKLCSIPVDSTDN